MVAPYLLGRVGFQWVSRVAQFLRVFFFSSFSSLRARFTESAVHRLNAFTKHFRFQFVDRMYRIHGGHFFPNRTVNANRG